jgi:hypothetical protein
VSKSDLQIKLSAPTAFAAAPNFVYGNSGLRVLSPDIYIVIHNQAFPADKVRKDREQARFVQMD